MKWRTLAPNWIVLVGALWMATLGNLALWRRLSALGILQAPGGWQFAAGLSVMIFGALVWCLGLLAWRPTLKIFMSLLLVITAVCAYFMLNYGVIIDAGMIVNALQTDVHEASAFLGWRLLTALLGLAIIPGWFLWRQPVNYGTPMRQLLRNFSLMALGLGLSVAAALICFQTLAPTLRNHKEVRYLINPLAALYATGRVVANAFIHHNTTIVPTGIDAKLLAGARPSILLLVLGETGRSGNFSLNGYARATNPELQSRGAVSLRNAWSCGTSTAESVPCMFSDLGREGFTERNSEHEGLLDVLQRAGLAVLWIDNQAGCKGVCARVPTVSTASNPASPLCNKGECLDGAMLEGLDQRIATLDPARVARGLVLVMHQMGSHGPAYYLRSPLAAKRFLPECRSAALQACSRASVINAYDNSIVYTDQFLGQAIDWLKTRPSSRGTAMIYVADHGESLGENNLYLHGIPYALAPDVQKHVPWITWTSEELQQTAGLSSACLQNRRDQRVSHDNYFHSVLGFMNVQTRVYQAALDIYAPCRKPPR